jgi:glyoxylate/hydroxypyruvate reductase A
MAVLVLTHPQPPEPFVEELRRVLPDELVFTEVEAARAHAKNIETVLLWRLSPGVLDAFPSIKFLAASAAGVDKIIGPALPPSLPLTRTVDLQQNQQIAQYVCAMILRHVRQHALYQFQQNDKVWKRHPISSPSSVTVGLMGLGESGQVVATALLALGFRVCGWSRSPKKILNVESFCGSAGLLSMVGYCQILVCLLPLTPETISIVNAELLAKLPHGAFFINVARGLHVVEQDLAQALQSGQLAGAALDVQGKEPMPSDDPLWDVPHLLITPHVASLPSAKEVVSQLAENLLRVRRGEPLLRLVDTRIGY